MAIQTFTKRQYAVYALIVVLTAIVVSAAYRLLNRSVVLFRRGESSFARGDYTTAVALYEQAFAAGLRRVDAAVHLLTAYRATGIRNADPFIMEKVVRNLRTPVALLGVVDGFASQQMWTEAINVLEGHPDIWAREPAVILRLADMYRNLEEEKHAEQWYQKALLLNPRSLYGRFRLAEMMAWQTRYLEAESLLRSILSDYPGHRLTMIYLARVLSWQNRLDEAIEFYEQAIGDTS